MKEQFTKGIEELKNKLIDTSRRNKLINYKKPSKARNLKIIDESAEFIFNYLIKEEGKFKFDSIPEPDYDSKALEQLKSKKKEYEQTSKNAPSTELSEIKIKIAKLDSQISEIQIQILRTPEERAKELGFNISNELPDINLEDIDVEEKHIDDTLQTLHYPNEMEKILTNIERNSKNIIDETGSNMLYLVLGVLQWTESKNSEHINKSPLINIPIILSKVKRANRYVFTLEYSGEGLDTNRSLAEKLLFEFGIVLPELTEEICFIEYLQLIQSVISDKKDWSLKQEIALDFLHFGKILMYQDLKEENWDEDDDLSNNSILNDIFVGKEVVSDTTFAPEYDIDTNTTANRILLVMDADSSQHSAIVDVLDGKNVIIEGPPGTGKSQTISNIIASLLAEGKSVLFVSEKLAALEVVYKRLNSIGLSDFCLELHSNKSQKTKILHSIKKRMETKYEDITLLQRTIDEIEHKKIELKEYIDTIHLKFANIDENIYNIFWASEKYYKAGEYLKIDIEGAKSYSHSKVNDVIEELKKYKSFHDNYEFETFFWNGLDVFKLNFIDIDNFINLLNSTKTQYVKLNNEFKKLEIDIEDEYEEISNISYFMANTRIKKEVNPDILRCTYRNVKELKLYNKEFQVLTNAILKISENLNTFKTYTDYNTKLINIISNLENILKSINRETNLPKNHDIYFITNILIGIKNLAKIDKQSYVHLTPQYGTVNFGNTLLQAEEDFHQYNEYKDNILGTCKLDIIDTKTIEEIVTIEKFIIEKKDSFFNFFSSDYKTAKKELQSLLNNNLPNDKKLWLDIIKSIKIYIEFQHKFINNSKYQSIFNNLFHGINTDFKKIKELHQLSILIRAGLKNNDLISLFMNGDELTYNALLSYQDNFENKISEFNSLINEISDIYDDKNIKKFYYDKDDINILEFRDKLEAINDNVEKLSSSIYKTTHINPTSNLEVEFLKIINTINLEDVFTVIKRYDSGVNGIVFNFEELISSFSKLNLICEKIKENSNVYLNISNNTNIEILKTLEFYNNVNASRLNQQLKDKLIVDLSYKDTLSQINLLYLELQLVDKQIQEYGNINKTFYGADSIKLSDCIKKLNEVSINKNTLSIWSDFRKISHSIIDLGLEELVNRVESKEIPLEQIVNVFKFNFYNSLIKDIFRTHPKLNKFSRLSHEQVIKTFKNLDLQLIEQNRKKVAYLAAQADIPNGYRGARKSDLTEFALIEHQVNLKKRHIPIRQLVKRASGALKGLKPCFMMSPLSVSQYLPPNKIKFDVLVIDEASQLRPEEALGSIARVNQIVVVGDPKQLPPTSFFNSLENTNDSDEMVASESESILDICLNLYKPIRQLRWHYRSQHESLIDFSNQQFYDGNLIVFPSPSSISNDELGVKYHYIENSMYQNRRNKVEAKIIIEHLEKQMNNYPNKSIGVGTFNSDQRDLIQELLDEREKISPIISNYIANWSLTSEAFFIKNLENLQGDERDVIFISTTYGKDKETRKIYQRFGPINTDTGWRRLNVMFTRAKQKMEVFTSMSSSDIIVSENSSRGVRALKSFLSFLETGIMHKAPDITGKGFDSGFEESVYNILDDCGFKSIPQVGVAGYFIDLSVVSDKNPNDFILAIECDGATYHSSKSARDRDRLKQEVLERLGWTVYRIWSVDWYKNREHEISKLISAVKEAQANYKGKIQSNYLQEITVEEIVEIDDDIEIEIEKEKKLHHHKEATISTKQYTQTFLTDEKIKEMLIEFRDTKIAQEFQIDKRCILSDIMIEVFIKYKPIDLDEFRSKVPIRYRNENVINIEQMKFIVDIFELLELADE